MYAKRRDTKAYELLASQLFNLTHGEGEDWTRAQELGLTIDPDNFLYQPGGRPEEVRLPSGQVVAEPLGASTMPYTSSAPPAFKPAADATLDNAALDLDLELDLPARAASLPASDATQPHGARAARSDSTLDQRFSSPSEQTLDLSLEGDADETLPLRRPATAPEAPSPGVPGMAPSAKAQPSRSDDMTLDFDLLSLDEGTTTVSLPRSAQTAEPADDFGAFDLGSETVPEAAQGSNDPLTRKLDLAEEFRQIGDLEGARDLLEEVLAKSEGALHAKAQGMLDKLG